MAIDINTVDLLPRREIEALIASPLIRGYAETLGAEKAEQIASKITVLKNMAPSCPAAETTPCLKVSTRISNLRGPRPSWKGRIIAIFALP